MGGGGGGGVMSFASSQLFYCRYTENISFSPGIRMVLQWQPLNLQIFIVIQSLIFSATIGANIILDVIVEILEDKVHSLRILFVILKSKKNIVLI